MRSIIGIFLLFLTLVLVRGQTETITNAAGETVVVDITVDPVQGLPSTQTLQTVVGDADETTATTPAATATATTTAVQGPVGAPAPTLTGETTFQYTTTDANGDPLVVDDTFTPSFDTVVVTPTPTFTGTILDYSSWINQVGSNTVADQTLLAGGAPPALVSREALMTVAVLSAGILGGMWIAL